MKIAIFRRIDEVGSWESIDEADSFMENNSKYIRISEHVEIDFPMLPPEDTVQKEIAALNAEKDREQARHIREVAKIDERIGKLQAITHQPDTPPTEE